LFDKYIDQILNILYSA